MYESYRIEITDDIIRIREKDGSIKLYERVKNIK